MERVAQPIFNRLRTRHDVRNLSIDASSEKLLPTSTVFPLITAALEGKKYTVLAELASSIENPDKDFLEKCMRSSIEFDSYPAAMIFFNKAWDFDMKISQEICQDLLSSFVNDIRHFNAMRVATYMIYQSYPVDRRQVVVSSHGLVTSVRWNYIVQLLDLIKAVFVSRNSNLSDSLGFYKLSGAESLQFLDKKSAHRSTHSHHTDRLPIVLEEAITACVIAIEKDRFISPESTKTLLTVALAIGRVDLAEKVLIESLTLLIKAELVTDVTFMLQAFHRVLKESLYFSNNKSATISHSLVSKLLALTAQNVDMFKLNKSPRNSLSFFRVYWELAYDAAHSYQVLAQSENNNHICLSKKNRNFILTLYKISTNE